MGVYYFETAHLCGIRKGLTAASVRREVLREVGTRQGVGVVREATAADVSHILGMGGHVPDEALKLFGARVPE